MWSFSGLYGDLFWNSISSPGSFSSLETAFDNIWHTNVATSKTSINEKKKRGDKLLRLYLSINTNLSHLFKQD